MSAAIFSFTTVSFILNDHFHLEFHFFFFLLHAVGVTSHFLILTWGFYHALCILLKVLFVFKCNINLWVSILSEMNLVLYDRVRKYNNV